MNSKKLRVLRRGFTLIELMVVVTNIGVLATFAMPIFTTFMLRAKCAEREAMMATIARLVQDYQNEHNQLPMGGGTLLVGDWNPPLPVIAGKKTFDPAAAGWNVLGFTPEGNVRFHYHLTVINSVSARVIIVEAMSDLDGNGLVALKSITYTLTNGTVWNQTIAESGDLF